MRLQIVVAPDGKLRKVSEPIDVTNEEETKHLSHFLDSMIETCRHIQGMGLSAIQVGIPSRIFVVVTEECSMDFINPEIISTSDDEVMLKEGCLSFPGIFLDIKRPKTVRVRYYNRKLEQHELEATGMVARCILHEMDHLDGVTFVQKLGVATRNLIMGKMKKVKKQIEQAIARKRFEMAKEREEMEELRVEPAGVGTAGSNPEPVGESNLED